MDSFISINFSTSEYISAVPRDSSAFHTGMMDLSLRAEILQENLMDIVPYMYASISNIIFTCFWIVAIIGIFVILKRKKLNLESFDKAEGV